MGASFVVTLACGEKAVGHGPGSTTELDNSTITDNANFGVTAFGGAVTILDSLLSNNGIGVYAEDGGTVQFYGSTIADNTSGVLGFVGSAIRVSGSSIERNATGVVGLMNSSIQVRDGSIITESIAEGVHLDGASALNIEETAVANNSGPGIQVEGSSTVVAVTIANNAGDGIELRDLSNGQGGAVQPGSGPVEITNNDGWGINCAGPAAITEAQNGFAIPEIVFIGNTNGDTNCP